MFVFFFFKQKTAYEMRISDWSSDVCSSDLGVTGCVHYNTCIIPVYLDPQGRYIRGMTHLRDMLSNFLGDRLITAETARVAYTQTEGHHPGELPALVAQPVSIEEVRQLVRAAAAQGVPIAGYVSGTSLEGQARNSAV